MKVLTENIDARPYTGVRNVSGKLRVRNADWLNHYFDGTQDYEQVKNVTVGKTYEVVMIEGLGDVEDVTFIDDTGEQQTLGAFFFEKVED